MKYLKYLNYLIRHKWHVFIECWKRGIFWRGQLHDWSKFLPSEFFPYANFFYSIKDKPRTSTGYTEPAITKDEVFDYAWLFHQKRNKHHWQWWVLGKGNGEVKILEMPHKYRLEMLCDWIGAGKAQGFSSPKEDPLQQTRNWWLANNHKMQFHPNTRDWIEQELSLDNISTSSSSSTTSLLP